MAQEQRGQGATLDEVARAAGVSRATVSRVVNGTRNVDPALAHMVQQAIAATGYVPNRAARSLRTRVLGAVALVVSTADATTADVAAISRSFTDPYFGRIVSAALLALQQQDVRLELLHADSQQSRAALVGRLLQRDVDGVLIVSMHTADPLPALVAQTGKPAVLLGAQAVPVPLSRVDLDHRAGGVLAAERLLQHGCRRVAAISGPSTAPGSIERTEGFLAAMRTAGQTGVPVADGAFNLVSGEKAMASLLRELPQLDGVFAGNDLMAQGALLTLREHDRVVPDDVAVVGFDDSSVALDTRPPLTTVRQPLEEMATEMVGMLLEQVAGGRTPSVPRVQRVQPSLVVRSSA